MRLLPMIITTLLINVSFASSHNHDQLEDNNKRLRRQSRQLSLILEEKETSDDEPLCIRCKTVRVVFHILGNSADDNDDASDSNNKNRSNAAKLWTSDQIYLEMAHLNHNWRNTPFQFGLRDVIRYYNDEWSNMLGFLRDDETTEAFDEKVVAKTRIGGSTTINIYINDGSCHTSSEVIGGEAIHDYLNNEFMWPLDTYSNRDFISMCSQVISSVSTDLLTHEMGHWLGLSHTFQGDSCDPSNRGDQVDDTPQMLNCNPYTCIEGQNSCPDRPGVDPIDNYMSYSNCPHKRFTDGQQRKMYNDFTKYRDQSQSCDSADEAAVTIDVQFDEDPENNNALVYRRWGEEHAVQIPLLSPQVDYSNQRITYTHCLPYNTMFEYLYELSGDNAAGNNGYISYSLDGRPLYHYRAASNTNNSEFGNTKSSVLIIAGRNDEYDHDNNCDNGARFRLEFQLDSRPEDKEWKLVSSSNGKLIASQATTGAYGVSHYHVNWRGSTLYYVTCLPPSDDTYEFHIADTKGQGIDVPGYYKLYLNDVQIHDSTNRFAVSETKTFTVVAAASNALSYNIPLVNNNNDNKPHDIHDSTKLENKISPITIEEHEQTMEEKDPVDKVVQNLDTGGAENESSIVDIELEGKEESGSSKTIQDFDLNDEVDELNNNSKSTMNFESSNSGSTSSASPHFVLAALSLVLIWLL